MWNTARQKCCFWIRKWLGDDWSRKSHYIYVWNLHCIKRLLHKRWKSSTFWTGTPSCMDPFTHSKFIQVLQSHLCLVLFIRGSIWTLKSFSRSCTGGPVEGVSHAVGYVVNTLCSFPPFLSVSHLLISYSNTI